MTFVFTKTKLPFSTFNLIAVIITRNIFTFILILVVSYRSTGLFYNRFFQRNFKVFIYFSYIIFKTVSVFLFCIYCIREKKIISASIFTTNFFSQKDSLNTRWSIIVRKFFKCFFYFFKRCCMSLNVSKSITETHSVSVKVKEISVRFFCIKVRKCYR